MSITLDKCDHKEFFIGTFSSHKEFSLAQACAAGKRLSKLTYWDLISHNSED